jgi:predicted Zn-dependent protease
MLASTRAGVTVKTGVTTRPRARNGPAAMAVEQERTSLLQPNLLSCPPKKLPFRRQSTSCRRPRPRPSRANGSRRPRPSITGRRSLVGEMPTPLPHSSSTKTRLAELAGRAAAVVVAASMLAAIAFPTGAAGQNRAPSLIRDAEIEGLLRLYTRPIFRAAGLNPGSVKVYIINDHRINAFVAGGQRLFIHTGLLAQASSPNQVIGVLAHETGHIAGGHLARMGMEIDRQSTAVIIGTLLGAAAMAGGAVAGDSQLAGAGQGVMLGTQSMAQRLILNYARAMESSADQAALKFLNATHQSARGMLSLFQKLANQSIGSIQYVDPYVQSHPMPFERIRNLEEAAKKSPYFDAADPAELILRHELMQAKLVGFLSPAQTVFQRYPTSDASLPARYARAIAMFRSGDTRNALAVIDTLIRDLPKDPYFWEIKAQALLEGGQPQAAIAPIKEAIRLLPNNSLLQVLYAQALLGTESKANAERALAALKIAKKTETDMPRLYQYMAMAYGILGDFPRAELATAEAAYMRGDKKLATEKAKIAVASFKRGSPDWLRANDLLNFASRE